MIIERKLWDDMRHTIQGISMPLVAHQQISQLLNHVEQQASNLEGAPATNGVDHGAGKPKETSHDD